MPTCSRCTWSCVQIPTCVRKEYNKFMELFLPLLLLLLVLFLLLFFSPRKV